MSDKTKIFQKGSTTYFYSSIFFPKKVKEQVFTLYAFVRVADNFVDCIPQQKGAFLSYYQETKDVFEGKISENKIITDFVTLCDEVGIEFLMVESFLKAMEADLYKKSYKNFKELEEYMYGSAEIIGYFMAKILRLPDISVKYAMLQGKAMQLINFIRDVKEDLSLDRIYMPLEDLERFKIKIDNINQNEDSFNNLIKYEIERYFDIQQKAEIGYKYIPYRYKIPIKTASDMYNLTAQIIYNNPQTVFVRKVKPTAIKVILQIIRNSVLQ